jgi:hypothetical protein
MKNYTNFSFRHLKTMESLVEYIQKNYGNIFADSSKICGKAVPVAPNPRSFNVVHALLDFVEKVMDDYSAGKKTDSSLFSLEDARVQMEFLPGRYENDSIIPMLLEFLETGNVYRMSIFIEVVDDKEEISHIILRHVDTDEIDVLEKWECIPFLKNFFGKG